jgi:hypothetical protein
MLTQIPATNHCNYEGEATMAKLHIAQLEYLSQELIDHLRNAYNLMGRGKFELDLAQRTLKALLNAQDQWIREDELEAEES